MLSYEIPKRKLLNHALARIARINSTILDAQPWLEDPKGYREELDKMRAAGDEFNRRIAKNLLLIEAAGDYTTAKIRGTIHQFRTRVGVAKDAPMLVVVDSINKMKTGIRQLDDAISPTQRITRLAWDLKVLARESNAAFIVISEITKEAYKQAMKDGRVSWDCIRDSFQVQHSMDGAMLLQTLPTEDKEDQLSLFVESSLANEDDADEIEDAIRKKHPIEQEAAGAYARLSIGMTRYRGDGDSLFLYEKAYHNFVPINPKALRRKSTW